MKLDSAPDAHPAPDALLLLEPSPPKHHLGFFACPHKYPNFELGSQSPGPVILIMLMVPVISVAVSFGGAVATEMTGTMSIMSITGPGDWDPSSKLGYL